MKKPLKYPLTTLKKTPLIKGDGANKRGTQKGKPLKGPIRKDTNPRRNVAGTLQKRLRVHESTRHENRSGPPKKVGGDTGGAAVTTHNAGQTHRGQQQRRADRRTQRKEAPLKKAASNGAKTPTPGASPHKRARASKEPQRGTSPGKRYPNSETHPQ